MRRSRPPGPREHALWLCFALLLVALPQAAANGWLLPGVDDVDEPHPTLVAGLHRAADVARERVGLAPTAWDEGLARAARQNAAELAERRVLDHASPTPGRHTVADRLARSGSPYTTHGENLAFVPVGFDPVSASVDGWLASPPHRANLLAPGFDRVGFGTADDGRGGVYVVQVLAGAPWSPTRWSATVAETRTQRVAFGIRADRAVAALVEVDGRSHRIDLLAGVQSVAVEVDGGGPWRVRIGVLTRAPDGFTLDEAGAVAASGSWRPDAAAPRRHLRVGATEAGSASRSVVRVEVDAAGAPPGLALLVDGTHRPAAATGPGRLAIDLDLADGGDVSLGLAEADGSGRLLVRHAIVLVREGDRVRWEARP